MTKKECPVCGAIFWGRANEKYCSKQCARLAHERTNFCHKMHRDQGRVNPYLLYAYDFRCGVCGWSLPLKSWDNYTPQRGCQFHHIIPVCEGGKTTEDNMILLCPNCHALAHHGDITRDQLNTLTKTLDDAMKVRRMYVDNLGLSGEALDWMLLNKDGFWQKAQSGDFDF